MSKRNWDGALAPWIVAIFGLCVVALFAFALVYSKGYQRANQDHESDYAAHYAAQRDYEECLAKVSVKEAVECAKEADKAYRENARAKQDLNAQREMADWAEGMLWATSLLGVASLIIGGVGVYFVHKTLEATRGATDAAIDNAKAAAISIKMMEREVRPYLYFESSSGEISRKANGFRASGEITFKNSGVSPAILVYRGYLAARCLSSQQRCW